MDSLITADNWLQPPNHRAAFQQVQALFPSVRIRRGRGTTHCFENAPIDLTGLPCATTGGDMRTIGDMIQNCYVDAFVVLKDGRLVFEHYANGMSISSHHLLNSVTKSVIGMLTGIVVDTGVVNPADPVTKYLPELRDTAFSGTSLRHALDMSAAVAYNEDYENPDADFWRETAVVGWRPALSWPDSSGTLFEFIKRLQGKAQTDGEKYTYRTVLTNLIGMVLERATGRRLGELLETELWTKLGADEDAAIVADRSGFPYVGAGMNASARDLARFGQMIAQRGFFNGQQIVPAWWIDETLQPNPSAISAFAQSDYGPALPGAQYRNQCWVIDPNRGVLTAIGIYGQFVYIDLSNSVTIVQFSSQPKPADAAMFLDVIGAMSAVAKAL
jgi:CubicO group peptidase (beta-lactamase class C family)